MPGWGEGLPCYVQDESTLRTGSRKDDIRDDSTDEQLQAEFERLTEARFEKVLVECDTSALEIEARDARGEADVGNHPDSLVRSKPILLS